MVFIIAILFSTVLRLILGSSATEEPLYRRTGKLNQFVGLVTPRPLPQDDRYVFASIWASWSAWSYCINNVQVRVRACNTVRGFSCLGSNQERRECESRKQDIIISESDYDVIDPWKADREEAMKQLYSDYQLSKQKNLKQPSRNHDSSVSPKADNVITSGTKITRIFSAPQYSGNKLKKLKSDKDGDSREKLEMKRVEKIDAFEPDAITAEDIIDIADQLKEVISKTDENSNETPSIEETMDVTSRAKIQLINVHANDPTFRQTSTFNPTIDEIREKTVLSELPAEALSSEESWPKALEKLDITNEDQNVLGQKLKSTSEVLSKSTNKMNYRNDGGTNGYLRGDEENHRQMKKVKETFNPSTDTDNSESKEYIEKEKFVTRMIKPFHSGEVFTPIESEEDTKGAVDLLLSKMFKAASDVRASPEVNDEMKTYISKRKQSLHHGEILTSDENIALQTKSRQKEFVLPLGLKQNQELAFPEKEAITAPDNENEMMEKAFNLNLVPQAPSTQAYPSTSPIIIDSSLVRIIGARKKTVAQWSNWTQWGTCFCGKMVRTRSCIYDDAYLTDGCVGNSFEAQPCEDMSSCPTTTNHALHQRTYYTLLTSKSPRIGYAFKPRSLSRVVLTHSGSI